MQTSVAYVGADCQLNRARRRRGGAPLPGQEGGLGRRRQSRIWPSPVTTYLCRDPERLRLVWSLPKEADTEVRLTLRPVPSTETLLTLEHGGLEHGSAIDYGVGWEDLLIRLDTVMHGDGAESVQWDDVKEAATPVWTAVVENRAGTRSGIFTG